MSFFYIVDTSSLISEKIIQKQHSHKFGKTSSPWHSKNGLFLPNKYAMKSTGAMIDWCNGAQGYSDIFHETTQTVARSVEKIVQEHPELAKPDKMGPEADPFVIAMAIEMSKQTNLDVTKPIIVTQENKNKPNKIPKSCKRIRDREHKPAGPF